MSKYRFKTKEEFIRDGLWNDKYNCPDEWAWEGQMNKYLGIDVPEKFNMDCDEKKDFKHDGWHFNKVDYILKEQQKYFNDLSQHIGRYIRALVDNPHQGRGVYKGDIGKIIDKDRVDFPNFKRYHCTCALDKNNLGTKYELLPEDYSPEQETKGSKIEFIPGKWYKYNGWYIKYKDHVDDVWRSSEQINYSKKYSKIESRFGDRDSDDKKILLLDLSEIQEYLPEGHPDKVKVVNLKVGKWYSFNWDWSGKERIVVAKIKEVTEKDFIISWRSYLWNDNDYNDSDGYFFKDISNIKELSIEEVQPYLPNGHPDKIINQKFEIGKWYKWYQKNHGKYHFGKVERINTETDTVVMLPWIIGCTDYNYSGYFDLSKAEQIQEISVEEVQEFLPKKHSDKISSDEFKKGEYIVITDKFDSWVKDFISNYIYKQRKDSTYLQPEYDSSNSRSNGWIKYTRNNSHNWRYATQEEIDEYERRGKPYDVTELQKKELFMKEIQEECKKKYPIGCTYISTDKRTNILKDDLYTYCIIRKTIWGHSGGGYLYENGKWAELVSLPEENITEIPDYVECVNYFGDKYTGKIYNTKLDKPEKISTNTWYGILIDCGRLKDGSFKISNKEAYEKQKNWLGNSEESISKFTPILDSYEGTIANISVCDAIMQYPSISANYWKEIPKFVEQEFDIYGPTPDIE